MEKQHDYTRQEAAERLAMSDQSIDKLIRAKALECYRVGRRVWIKGESLEAFLARCRAGGSDSPMSQGGV